MPNPRSIRYLGVFNILKLISKHDIADVCIGRLIWFSVMP